MDNTLNIKRNRGIQGIHNMGNTCYINTSIQCLGHCTSFLYFVIGGKYSNKPTGESIIECLRKVYIDIWIHDEKVIPRELLKCIFAKMNGLISMFEQNDINEFIYLLIDKLNSEICKPMDIVSFMHQPYSHSQYDIQRKKMDLSWCKSNQSDYSELKDMFYGQTISQIVCGGCGKIHHNYEVFMNIMLSIEDHNDIYKCICELHKDEEINTGDAAEDAWKCDGCNQSVKSKKITKIWRLPKILIISLKRFNMNLTKNSTFVTVPESIDMSPFTIGPKAYNYVLRSVAYHGGSNNSGHYVAICRSATNDWYHFDDDVVNKITCPIQDVIKQGYVYFYEAID